MKILALILMFVTSVPAFSVTCEEHLENLIILQQQVVDSHKLASDATKETLRKYSSLVSRLSHLEGKTVRFDTDHFSGNVSQI